MNLHDISSFFNVLLWVLLLVVVHSSSLPAPAVVKKYGFSHRRTCSTTLMLGHYFPAQGSAALYWLNTAMAWYSPHLQTYSFVRGVEKSTLVLSVLSLIPLI